MEHFYHFYVVHNNVENIDHQLEVNDLIRLEKFWSKILNKIRIEPKKEVLEKIVKQVEKL